MSEHLSEDDEFTPDQHALSKKFSEPNSPTFFSRKSPSIKDSSPLLSKATTLGKQKTGSYTEGRLGRGKGGIKGLLLSAVSRN
jgi:hypothetical protein